jgi:hypothetical protein
MSGCDELPEYEVAVAGDRGQKTLQRRAGLLQCAPPRLHDGVPSDWQCPVSFGLTGNSGSDDGSGRPSWILLLVDEEPGGAVWTDVLTVTSRTTTTTTTTDYNPLLPPTQTALLLRVGEERGRLMPSVFFIAIVKLVVASLNRLCDLFEIDLVSQDPPNTTKASAPERISKSQIQMDKYDPRTHLLQTDCLLVTCW